MTRLAFLLAFAIGLAIGASLCKRKPPPPKPCPEYKVYGEAEVQEMETLAKTRRLSR